MPRPRFQKLPPDKRNRILDVAARRFAADGFEGASLNRILDEAGLSKGAAYYYFDDKADLFATVVETAFEEVTRKAGLEFSRIDPADPWPALERIYRLQFETFADRPHVWRAAKSAKSLLDHPSGARIAPRIGALLAGLERLLAAGQAAGHVRSDIPLPLLMAMIAGLDDAIDTWFLDHPEVLGGDPDLPGTLFETLRNLLTPPRERP